LFFGSALDEAFNAMLEDKQHGREVNPEAAKAIFCNKFAKAEVNGVERQLWEPGVVKFSKADLDESLLTQDDLNSGLNKSWCSLNRKGQILVDEYYKQVIPKLEKVLAVQHKITLENDKGERFEGLIDFIAQIDGKRYLIDNKTTSITYKVDSATESAQLATYFDATKDEFKLDGVMYITIPKKIRKVKKPPVEISFIPGLISEDLIESTYKDYDRVIEGIKARQFPCTPEVCCSQPWGCSYKRFCTTGDMTGLIYVDKKEQK
jgi:PD-(D/E)XK nuclease superfamily